MMSYYYLAIIITLVAYTVYGIIGKKYIGGAGYQNFVPIFVFFVFIGSLVMLFASYHRISFESGELQYFVLLGVLYTAASYLVFYSLERERLGVVSTILASQGPLIALFSSFLFKPLSFPRAALASYIIIVGVIILTVSFGHAGNKYKKGINRIVALAITGNLIWVIMWVIFYKIPGSGTPISYFTWVSLFAVLSSAAMFVLMKAGRKHVKVRIKQNIAWIAPISAAGFIIGLGTSTFAFSYIINPVFTPIIVELSGPLVLIASVIILKEKFSTKELVGLLLILAGIFSYSLL